VADRTPHSDPVSTRLRERRLDPRAPGGPHETNVGQKAQLPSAECRSSKRAQKVGKKQSSHCIPPFIAFSPSGCVMDGERDGKVTPFPGVSLPDGSTVHSGTDKQRGKVATFAIGEAPNEVRVTPLIESSLFMWFGRPRAPFPLTQRAGRGAIQFFLSSSTGSSGWILALGPENRFPGCHSRDAAPFRSRRVPWRAGRLIRIP